MNNFTDYANAISMCAKFESIRLNSYQDIAGVWTIGYGTTVYPDTKKKVGPNQACTSEEAMAWLMISLKKFNNEVLKLIKVELKKQQWEALLCLAYNIGSTALSNSTVLKRINTDPNDLTISEAWLRFINSGGKPRRGLLRRRLYEVYWYFTY